MTIKFSYDQPENHVERRDGLSAALRQQMFEMPRSQWADDPRFQGEPAFWLDIHQGLLKGSALLAEWTEDFVAENDDTRRDSKAGRIATLGERLVQHAHGHHHIEDHYFFPVFLRLFPQLEHALELLDGDHKVLGEVLDELEEALRGFEATPVGSDAAIRDAWATGGEKVYRAAKRLDALFIRHIGDEEEICVPAMLSR
jgi:Hemerythrin HHE cation binding domain